MILLKEINDTDILTKTTIQTTNEQESILRNYDVRRAARAVVIKPDGEIAIMFAARDNYYKLPGGGIEVGEEISDTLKREILEEVGVEITISAPVGMIIEYRNRHNFLQISYCYLCQTNGAIGKPRFTPIEIEEGFELQWLSIEEALEKLNQSEPEEYGLKYIQVRDTTFLKRAKDLINGL